MIDADRIVETTKRVMSGSGLPSFMACTGKDLNAILGIDYLPENHTFEVDFIKLTILDVTSGMAWKL